MEHPAGSVSTSPVATAIRLGAPVTVRNFDEWRMAARLLLATGRAPHDVDWRSPEGAGDLFAAAPLCAQTDNLATADASALPALKLPRRMVQLLEDAACFNAPGRWAFLYWVLWRWQQGQKEVQSAADADGARLHSMARAVQHEEHDMRAYLRFRERGADEGLPRFVAWFEPEHDILPRIARHFAERMGQASWMIATPRASACWDGERLELAGPLPGSPARIDDAGEALWLTYYRSIFNPARLNAGLMHQHVAARFWKHLPEAAVVPAMVAAAATGTRRSGQAESVGQRDGTVIQVAAEAAQPQRAPVGGLEQCRRCELWRKATQAVPGAGPADARIMLVGEQPGDQEDLAGQPFVGPAGRLLDLALAQAQLERASLYLTNAVKHFKWEPRGKRRIHKTPAQREVTACHAWLENELETVRPQVVVALGSTALKSVTSDARAALTERLGQPFRMERHWVIAVYHPAYVLRLADEAARQLALDCMVLGLRHARELAQA